MITAAQVVPSKQRGTCWTSRAGSVLGDTDTRPMPKASSAPPRAAEQPREHMVALRVAVLVAVIGAAAALGGSLIGGWVTWRAAHEAITSQQSEGRRAEKRNAYAAYYAEAAALATRVALDARQLLGSSGNGRV